MRGSAHVRHSPAATRGRLADAPLSWPEHSPRTRESSRTRAEDHKQLGRAATSLRSAEALVEDGNVEDQRYAEAHALADLADRDRAPDERRGRGHRHTLRELHGKTMHDDAQAHISRALDNSHSVEDAL